MPKVGSKTAQEDRLRHALRLLLERIGAGIGGRTLDVGDERLCWMAENVEIEKSYFVASSELDDDIPF